MKTLLKYLQSKYGIRIDKNDMINGTEFVVCFNVDYDIEESDDSVIKSDGTYITKELCKRIIVKEKIKELLMKLDNEFICPTCKGVFSGKQSLKRHLSKKNSCSTLVCKDCNVICSSKNTMNEHLKTKKHALNINGGSHNNLISGGKNTIDNSIDNSIHITNPTIILHYNSIFDNDKISVEDKMNILNGSLHRMIPEMIAMAHFSKKIPECQNIRYTNRQSKNAFVFSDRKWISEKVKTIAEELLLIHGRGLKNILEKYGVNLPEEKIKKIEEYVDLLFDIDVKNVKHSFEYGEACKKFLDNKKKQVERIVNLLYDETIRLGLKNPLKDAK